MPSTYTTNLGIEKIATGEQSGTWGTTTNTNFDLIDSAVNGIVSITLSSTGTSGSPNALPITDGTASNGRNKFIEFIDGGDLGGTAYVQLTPNDAEKIVHIRNSLSASRSILIFQGTYNASNDFEIPNGADVVLKFDGAGAGAVVSDVFNDLNVTKLTAASLASSGNMTFGDNDKAIFGAGSDLEIYHDGGTGESYITESGTANFFIQGTNLRLQDTSGANYLTAQSGGELYLYHNGLEKVQVNTSGITVTGTVTADGVSLGDSEKIQLGDSLDLQIWHDGSDSFVDDAGTGSLKLRGNNLILQKYTGENYVFCAADGATTVYYDDNAKFATTTNGVDITGRAEGTVTADNDGGFNLNSSNYFTCTPSASLDITFTNETAGVAGAILLVNTTPQTITVGPDVFLSDADLTAINSAGTYLLGFYCPDGTNVYVSATPALTEGS